MQLACQPRITFKLLIPLAQHSARIQPSCPLPRLHVRKWTALATRRHSRFTRGQARPQTNPRRLVSCNRSVFAMTTRIPRHLTNGRLVASRGTAAVSSDEQEPPSSTAQAWILLVAVFL